MYLDILGLVELEVRGESETLRNYLSHEYGVFEVDKAANSNSDIIIDLVDDVSTEERSVHVRGPVAYDDKGVFLHHNLPGDIEYNAFRIDFDAIGHKTCSVTCDREFNAHFFSIIVDYLIHFHLLQHDATYCHSCAFEYEGNVIVCPAWRQVGKTNLLLSFLDSDVSYIADDWCVLHKDGTVSALPKRLNLLYYNFKQYPELLENTPDEFESLVQFVNRAKSGEVDLNRDVIDTLTDQARMRISPYSLFDSVANVRQPVDHLFLLRKTNSTRDSVELDTVPREQFPYQKQSILEFEQSYFHIAYNVHKAQTGNVNPYLERSKEKTLEILQSVAEETPNLHELTVPSQRASNDLKQIIEDTVADE
jgi:hypothetical protein